MRRQRILVTGPASSVLTAAAVLAARWAGEDREVIACPDNGGEPESDLLLRPSHVKVHSLLGVTLADFQQVAGARPLLALEVKAGSGTLRLPFTEFGLAHSGVEFHHFWNRAAKQGGIPDLSHFSLALALDDHRDKITFQHAAKLPLKLGLRVNRAAYSGLMQQLLTQAGVTVLNPSGHAGEDADLVIRCGAERHSGQIDGSEIQTGGYNEFPDSEWQLAANCAVRFSELSDAMDPTSPERAEFNRLAAIECDRIEDMRRLLEAPDPKATNSPELKRKIDVFSACGRIPMEDFEFFQQPEWLAALWARDIRPARADRMAQLMPQAELTKWLSALHQQVQQIASAGADL